MSAVLAQQEDFPTLRQEIERKCLSELERLALGVGNGKMTVSQYRSSVMTLYNTVSGLVDKETTDLITRALGYYAPDESEWQHSLFMNHGNVMSALSWNAERNQLFLRTSEACLDVMAKQAPGVEAKPVYDHLRRKLSEKMTVL